MHKSIYDSLVTKLSSLTEIEIGSEKWHKELARISSELAREFRFDDYFFYESRLHDVTHRLGKIEKLLERGKSDDAAICRWRQEGEEHEILKLIIAGAPASNGGQIDSEKKNEGLKIAVETLQNWLKNANEVTVIDPFIFKRSQPNHYTEKKEETERLDKSHAQAILDILGKMDVVHFFYKTNTGDKTDKVSKGVADYIESNVKNNIKKVYFHVVEDLHDRIWIRKIQNEKDSAKVVGTSLDGIGKRPTYLLDLPLIDVPVIMKYVDSLRKVAQMDTSRPINFKKLRPA